MERKAIKKSVRFEVFKRDEWIGLMGDAIEYQHGKGEHRG